MTRGNGRNFKIRRVLSDKQMQDIWLLRYLGDAGQPGYTYRFCIMISMRELPAMTAMIRQRLRIEKPLPLLR